MEFHPQKCNVLPVIRSLSPQVNKYQLHGHILKTETDSKYLGITINNKLSWNTLTISVQKQILPLVSFVEIFKYLKNTSRQMSIIALSVLKWRT